MNRRELAYHLRRGARALGLLPSHREYRPFLILGKGRTGSSFLRSLLNSHPGIVAYAELFVSYDHPSWDVPYVPLSRGVIRTLRRDPARFLERHVFRRHPPSVAAVGLKMLYDHARHDAWRHVWDLLRHRPGLHVIHNTRRNLLATYLSWRRAELTGIWKVTEAIRPQAEEVARRVRLELDVERCRRFFEETEAQARQMNEFFTEPGCPVLEVVYEDLAENRDATLDRVQDFLGVERRSLEPQTHKQALLPPSEEIVNYEELRRAFSGTPWERFFNP